MRSLLPVLIAAMLAAGEAEPLVVTCADGAELVGHWQASPLGQAWGDPALASLRARAAKAIGDAASGLGTDPLLLARSLRGICCRILPGDGSRLRWGAQADFGTAATLLRTWVGDDGEPVRVPHADEGWRTGDHVVARFGTLIAIGGDAADLPLEPAAASADLAVRVDPPALVAGLPLETATEQVRAAVTTLARRFGVAEAVVGIGKDGSDWHGRIVADTAGWQPVDRTVLARLPAIVLAVAACGVDGRTLWRTWSTDVLGVVDAVRHPDGLLGPAATGKELDAALAEAGITVSLEEVVSGLSGTVLVAETPGVPIPGFTIALPRSPAIDRLAAGLFGLAKVVPPTDGMPALIPLGRQGLFQLMVTCDAGYWLATTDAGLASAWPAGGPGGFADRPLARNLAALAPPEACAVTASDTAAMVRLYQGLANPMLAMARDWTPAERQAVLIGMARYAAAVPPGAQWCVAKPDGFACGGRGDELTTMVVPMAVIAAIAIPNLLESRVAANEAAAAATMKSGIFPAEVQFQAGAYEDQDQDNVGEYGLLSELSGRRATGKLAAGGLKLLQGPLAQGDSANGYRYALYLPDGKGGAIGEPAAPGPRPSIVDGAAVVDADAQERRFVVYAWPLSHDSGRRMFALSEDGQVRSRPWDGREPAWNSLWDGAGWEAPPAWNLHRR